MAEPFISSRIIFPRIALQKRFIISAKNKLNLSWREFGELLNVNERTARDWVNRGMKMPYNAAVLLSRKTRTQLPSGVKEITWKDHLKSISSKGGLGNVKKNKKIGGDETYRKTKWLEWWGKVSSDHTERKKLHVLERKKIKIPSKDSELAEFVGIMIGDGGVAPYHATITLNSETDLIYSHFVVRMIRKLFGLDPKIYYKKTCKALDIVVQSRQFVEYVQSIGLHIGNKLKQGLDIPGWIISDVEFSKACLRGLIDTDGSLFIHTYVVKNRRYSYPKISFTSRSPALVRTVFEILKRLGFCARISGSGDDVRLESLKDVINYFKTIGSHNKKLWIKYNKWRVAPNGKAADC